MRGVLLMGPGGLMALYSESIMNEFCTDHQTGSIERAEKFIDNLREKGGMKLEYDPLLAMTKSYAHYLPPKVDRIESMRRCQFDEPAMYYRVVIHEAGHWTMPRVGRTGTMDVTEKAKEFGQRLIQAKRDFPDAPPREIVEEYQVLGRELGIEFAKEELVAEMCAAHGMRHLGLYEGEVAKVSLDYIAGYSNALDEVGHNDAIAWATPKAQEAFDYLMTFQ